MTEDYWADCQCGHGRADHYDETLYCEKCECSRYLRPGQRLRDVVIPNNAAVLSEGADQ